VRGPHSPIEAFAVSVFPTRPRLDVGRLGSDGSDPIPDGLCYELWPPIGLEPMAPSMGNSDRMYAGTPRRINRSVNASMTSLEFSFRFTRTVPPPNRRMRSMLPSGAFPVVSVQNVQCPERPAIIGSVVHPAIENAIGPSDNGEGRTANHDCETRGAAGHRTHPLPDSASRSDDTRGVQPQSPLLGLLHWHFKPLTFPQTLIHPLPAGGVYTAERGQPASRNKTATRR